ncbi:hypothetical protein B0I08_106201 [Glaciihabitans tibetensis]|uniref:DUF4190 domain-containing protein n=1 Tax=Glaciihabitans tibetensis TaxID=1266600 RepID=A0A2T0VBM9_9MICO|nr:DUF4190 domain-containing protein [Glaciihabitans tibetensis]PRY67594.1 hypothetical protein B0I08_106201 [Glaciihabitans tibetensis]
MTNNPEPMPYAAPEPTPYSSNGGAPAKSPVLSIISLIAGILGVLAGFIGWGLLFSIGAVVLGHLGQRKEPAAKGMWLTGLITGYAGIVLNLIILAIFIVALMAGISAYDMETAP